MIVYFDSSILVRAYLADEDGHEQTTELLEQEDLAIVTGTWTRIEVSGALVRAGRARRGDVTKLLALLGADLGIDGVVTVLRVDQGLVEAEALDLVRAHGLRAMDAWHLAVASLGARPLAEQDEPVGFASRDSLQSSVAAELGFETAL